MPKPFESRLNHLLGHFGEPGVRNDGTPEREAFEKASLPVSDDDLRPVVRKLHALFLNAVTEAKQCGVSLSPAHCLLVVEQAIAESVDASHVVTFPQTVEGVYLLSLYEELVQQASNIFDTVTRENGKQYYVALAPPVWRRCLEVLRTQLASG